jgi:hypothetical protein
LRREQIYMKPHNFLDTQKFIEEIANRAEITINRIANEANIEINKISERAHMDVKKFADEAKTAVNQISTQAKIEVDKISTRVKQELFCEKIEKIYKEVSKEENPIQLKAQFLQALLLNNQPLLNEILKKINLVTTDPNDIINAPRDLVVVGFQKLLAVENEKPLISILMKTFQRIPETSNISGDKKILDMKTKKQLLIDFLEKTEEAKRKSVISQLTDLSFDTVPQAFRPSLGDTSYQSTNIKPEDYKKISDYVLDISEFILLTAQLLTNLNADRNFIQKITANYLFVNYKECIKDIIEYCNENQSIKDEGLSKKINELSNNLKSYDPQKNDARRFFETRLSQYIIGLTHTKGTLKAPSDQPIRSGSENNLLVDGKFRDETLIACNNILKYYLGDSGEVNNPQEMEEKIAIFANSYKDATKFTKEESAAMKKFADEEARVYKGRERIARPPYTERKFEENPDKVAKDVAWSSNPGAMRSYSPNFFDGQLLPPVRNPLVEVSQVAPKDETKQQWFWDRNRHYAAYVGSISGHTCNIVSSLLVKYIKDNRNDPNLSRDINLFLIQVVGVYTKRGYHGMLEVMDIYHDLATQNHFKEYGVDVNLEKYFGLTVEGRTLLEYAVNDASKYIEVNIKKQLMHQELVSDERISKFKCN